jgi:hypothetical protein
VGEIGSNSSFPNRSCLTITILETVSLIFGMMIFYLWQKVLLKLNLFSRNPTLLRNQKRDHLKVITSRRSKIAPRNPVIVIRVSVLISKLCTGRFISRSGIYSFPNDFAEGDICQKIIWTNQIMLAESYRTNAAFENILSQSKNHHL